MPKTVTPLTDIQTKSTKPKDKSYKLADGGGLYLEVMPTGSKLWRMKFKQTNGKESRLAFGAYRENRHRVAGQAFTGVARLLYEN